MGEITNGLPRKYHAAEGKVPRAKGGKEDKEKERASELYDPIPRKKTGWKTLVLRCDVSPGLQFCTSSHNTHLWQRPSHTAAPAQTDLFPVAYLLQHFFIFVALPFQAHKLFTAELNSLVVDLIVSMVYGLGVF